MYPPCGQPGEAPVRLALAMLLLFTEELTDREAAPAAHICIDGK